MIKTELSPDFSVIHVDGVFGGISTDQGTAWVQVFCDLPNSEVSGANGDMAVTKIRRQILVDMRMSTSTYRAIAKWMEETVKKLDAIK